MSECEFEKLCDEFWGALLPACKTDPSKCDLRRFAILDAIEQAYAVAYGYDEFSPLPERIMQLRMEEK